MTKKEISIVADEFRRHIHYPDIDDTPLYGLGLPDFEKGKYVRKEVVVNFLNWQCGRMDGTVDEEEFENCISLFKEKKVVMI